MDEKKFFDLNNGNGDTFHNVNPDSVEPTEVLESVSEPDMEKLEELKEVEMKDIFRDSNVELFPTPLTSVEPSRVVEVLSQPAIVNPVLMQEEQKQMIPTMNIQTSVAPVLMAVAPKKRKKNILLLGIAFGAFIIVAATVGSIIYFGQKTNSKNAFLLSFNSLKSELKTVMEPANYMVSEIGDKYGNDGSFNINITSDMLTDETAATDVTAFLPLIENLNKTNFKFSYAQDAKEEKSLFQFIPSLENEDLINIKYLITGEKQYLFLGQILEKYIELEDTGEDMTTLSDYTEIEEDSTYIYETVLDSLRKNLKDDYFTKEDVTIKIDGKDKAVVKSTLLMDKNNISELIKNIIKDLQADKDASTIISKYYPGFSDYDTNINDNIEDGVKIYFSTYMSKFTGKQYKYEIKEVNGEEINLVTYTLNKQRELVVSYASKQFPEDNTTYRTLISMSDSETSIEMTDKDNNKILSMTLTENKLTLSFNSESDSTIMEGNFVYELKEQKEAGNYNVTSSASVRIIQEDMNLLTLDVDMDSSIKKDITIDEDVSKAVKLENMTAEDSQKIMDGLMELLGTLTQ